MTMAVLTVLVTALGAFYAFLLGSAAIGFLRTRDRKDRTDRLSSVSVVVPARNEESSIAACLQSILACDYPAALLEVIVVDDASTDDTALRVREVIRDATAATTAPAGVGLSVGTAAGHAHDDRDTAFPADARPAEAAALIRLVRMEEDPDRRAAHKKFALARGVDEARGEIIVTTDADCSVSRGWLRAIMSAFDRDTGMVTGPVLYRRGGSRFADLQALEFLGLVALGAGLVRAGRPHLCNSANLAYRRRAYYDVGGYEGSEDVTTGDDEMLLHKLAYDSPWTIRTCMHRDAAVQTDPSPSVSEFFAQRKRWASAHSRYPHLRQRLTSLLCYLMYLAAAALGVGLLIFPELGGLFAGIMTVKIVSEAALLVPAARRFGEEDLLPLLLPAQLVQLPYILIIGVAGTFGGFEWKGRRLEQ